MKFVLSKLAIGVALISCVSSAYALEINRHTLQLNQDQYVKYEGSNENFKQGFDIDSSKIYIEGWTPDSVKEKLQEAKK